MSSIELTIELRHRYKHYASSPSLELGGGGYQREEKTMLAILAAVLIILWLLGFFAFHVSTGLVHIALVVGLIMLVVHLLRGRSATA
jgi:hypothetical protein